EEPEISVGLTEVYGVEDEERKINMNMSKLTQGNKTEYTKILERLLPDPEGEEVLTRNDVINAIIDWQDTDGPVGDAENSYYEGLEHPYKCKNSDFDFIEELLLVKGVTPAFFEKIKDSITVYSEGKVNVNTAPAEVLTAILAYTELVEEVIKYRNGTDGEEGTEDDKFWTNANSFTIFLKNKGLKSENANEIKQYFTTKSDNFRITSHGTVGKVTSRITCVVKRESGSKKEKRATYEYYHEE
ncbi:MAG: general secretion pathway protein GspK, partial [Omnitrophica bacterium]|nr:general secretion pathway protein GspK [Candidatus Omnitrophota bacterium]